MFASRLLRRIHNDDKQATLRKTIGADRNTDYEGSSVPR
jgi:hypothetical protein